MSTPQVDGEFADLLEEISHTHLACLEQLLTEDPVDLTRAKALATVAAIATDKMSYCGISM